MAAVIRPVIESAADWRNADAGVLCAALQRGHEQLLALFSGFETALGPQGLRIAYDPVLNLPLWELGHIAWFTEFWLARNPQRDRGVAADPDAPRSASLLPGADALYDSSKVPHLQRWQLPLPEPAATRAYAVAVHEQTLALLRAGGRRDDDGLYFFRLALFHQAMHIEAWHFMAQQLGVHLGPAMTGQAPRAAAPVEVEWAVPGTQFRLGSPGPGFVFDNECAAHEVAVVAFSIDRAPVTWARFLPFVEAGAYADARWWSPAGWQWCQRQQGRQPRQLRRSAGGWQQRLFGNWAALDAAAPVVQVTAFEAEAWCRWAGRRLPTEAEWELAASRAEEVGEHFAWGQVWEWTATPFAPYPGFVPHPYRDYSAPWFGDGRPVLRGASFATSAAIRHARYRNFFKPDRDDVFAGFRSCALR